MKVTSSFHPPVLLAFGTTILSLVLVSAIPYRSYTRSRQSDGWIRQTHDVVHHLDDVLAATESAESKSRGFILTGEPFYLEAYRLSVVRTQQEETILRTLTADNRELQARLLFLQTLTAQAVHEQERLIHLRQEHGLQMAAGIPQGEPGRAMMARFETQVRELEDQELQLLARRREDAKRGLREDWIVLTLGMGLAILLAALMSWKAWRNRRIEEELLAEKERSQEARVERVRLQLSAMERRLEEKSQLQEVFLSHVSHELRTPLTAIYFFTTNLSDGLLGDLTAEQHEHLERTLTNVSQLQDMVDDLLDITRIDTQKFRLEQRQASPLRFIADVLSTCRNKAESKHVNLHSEAPGSLPFVWADVSRVRQILINLIDNAIKFTPGGGSVTVGTRPLKKNDDFLCLFVSDTGCGISPENLEIVFDRLAQLENARQASRNGLGLGLFIARELVSLHGGRIWVESPPGKGCTFYFTVPLFSLSKLCADIFTDSNLEAGHVTLMAIDVCAIAGTAQAEIEPEIRRVLSRCIHPGQDLLLPPMSDAVTVVNYFIVACTDAGGAAAIANQITRELQNFDSASQLKPVISSTTLLVPQGASTKIQAREIATRIEGLVQTHLETPAPVDQWSDLGSDLGSGLLVPVSMGSF
jgi:signal transduction histidine kinase